MSYPSFSELEMQAIVLETPGPVEHLLYKELPIPVPKTGEVLIRVRGFGLNRSEYHTRVSRLGLLRQSDMWM